MAGGPNPDGDIAVELPEIEAVEPTVPVEGKGDVDAPDTSTDGGTITNPNSGSGSEGGGSGLGSGNGGLGNGYGGTSNSVNTQAQAYNIPSLEDSKGAIASVAPNWRFIAIMPNISTLVGSSLNVSEAGGASYNSAKKLSSSNIPIAVCESVDIPPITIDTDQRFGGGRKIYVARFISTATLTLNFYEDEDFGVTKYLWAWHNSVVTKETTFYLPKDYKKDIRVWGFGNRSNTKPGIMHDFIECFPSISASGLNYSLSNNGFLVVSCEFSIDGQDTSFGS